MIIKRYFGRELLKTTFSVTLVLCFVFLCNQLVRLLGRVAAGKLSIQVLLKIILLQIPYLVGLLLPIGMYLAVLLVFSRLYVDHEMAVLSACGLSRWQIIRMILPTSLMVMLLVAAMTLVLNPKLLAIQTQLIQESPTKLLVETLTPGRFHVANDGKQVYYVESIDRETDTAKQVFMANHESPKGRAPGTAATWSVISAQSGHR